MLSGKSSLSPLRLCHKVPEQRKHLPYLDYGTPLICSHAHPNSQVYSHSNTWTGPRGYGGRHSLDDAPFSLWDVDKHDFRLPTRSEQNWLKSRHNPSAIDFQFPIMIIETANPPKPLPLTVAGVATKFVPPPPRPPEFNACGIRLEPIHDARPIGFSTDYAGMRGPEDPLQFTFRRWIQPTDEELKSLVNALCQFCNPRLIHFLCPRIIVELCCDDGRSYAPGSMPRHLGGFAAHYHHTTGSVFEGVSIRGRERIIQPMHSIQDTADYLQVYHELCPGVRVSSSSVTNGGPYAEVTMSTTAGVLLRNNHGQQRLTVSNHGFPYSDEVFHPSESGTRIGDIDERWPHLDIALAKLNPSVNFTNTTYFESKNPRRLLRSHEIPHGTFFSLDGMSTGIIYMQAQGLTLAIPKLPQPSVDIPFSKWSIYRSFGAVCAVPRDGVCGAAFVEDDTEEGGVAGFFQEGNAEWAMSPYLDELIDCSWSII